jgi:hypothetical protein
MRYATLLLGAILAATSAASAHHSAAGFFDQSKTIEVSGVVKLWRFGNPHPLMILETTDESGQKVEWHLEITGAATARAKQGWSTKTFTPGEVVTAVGNPSKRENSHLLLARRITRADGRPVP